MEYSPEGKFEDRPSLLFINREKTLNFPVVSEIDKKKVKISTPNLELTYSPEDSSGELFSKENLKIRIYPDGKEQKSKPIHFS